MLKNLTIASFLVCALFAFSSITTSAKTVTRTNSSYSPAPTPEIQVIQVQYEEVNPDDGSNYIMKRLKEKIALFFAFSDKAKADLQKKLVQARFAELKYTINNKQMAYFEKSTQRYFTAAGQLTEFLVSKNMIQEYGPIREMFLSYIPLLTQLRDTYNPTTAEWRFVEDDINYTKTYIQKLSQ